MRAGRFLLILIILIFSVCSLLFIFSAPILKLLATGLVVDQQIEKSDAVVVLGGSSPSRVLEAIDILNNGHASKLIISRGGKPEGLEYLNSKDIDFPEEADLNKFVANKRGVNDKEIILLPGRVYSTREEAEAIKKIALQNDYKSIIVTTSKSHSKRSALIFKRIFKNSGIDITIRPSKYDSFDPNNLNKNKNHWKEIVLEYQKIIYYYTGEFL